jgi:hypothetical protein
MLWPAYSTLVRRVGFCVSVDSSRRPQLRLAHNPNVALIQKIGFCPEGHKCRLTTRRLSRSADATCPWPKSSNFCQDQAWTKIPGTLHRLFLHDSRAVREARRHESGNVPHRKNWPFRHRRRDTGTVSRQIEEAADIADAAEIAHGFPQRANAAVLERDTVRAACVPSITAVSFIKSRPRHQGSGQTSDGIVNESRFSVAEV